MDKERLQKLRDLITIAKGGDPDAQSLLKELIRVDHLQEKSNYPAAIVQQKQTYLKMCEEYLEDEPELAKPFKFMSTWDAINWMSYKSHKFDKSAEMVKQGTDLSGLIMQPPMISPGQPAPEKKRFWSRKSEGEKISE